MYGPLKLSHHSHTGKRRPHEHTSYLPLTLLVLFTGVVLALFTVSSAGADNPPPEAGSIGLTGTVPEAPPTTVATITSPVNGQHFTSAPLTVTGTCPTADLVEIFKNNIFAGSTPCTANGSYSVQIEPLFGQNRLTAQVYDVLNQAGPMSKPITVFYDYSLSPAASSSVLNLTGAQLMLDTDAVFRGSFPHQQINVPITVIGGTAPFAVNVQWGDSSNSVIPQGSNTTFNAAHAYSAPGTYKITLQGTDSKQLVAFLTVAAIVNGQTAGAAATSGISHTPVNKFIVLWPVYAIAATAVVCFWIGEHREKKIIRKSLPSTTPTFGTAPPAPPAAPAPRA